MQLFIIIIKKVMLFEQKAELPEVLSEVRAKQTETTYELFSESIKEAPN